MKLDSDAGCSADFSSSLQLTFENRKPVEQGARKAPLRSQKAKGVWVKVAGCRSRLDWECTTGGKWTREGGVSVS